MSHKAKLSETHERLEQILSMAAQPAPVEVTRDPAAEAKIRGYLLGGLGSAQFIAMFTKTTVDDRLVARAMQKIADPVFWNELADDIWGPQ